MAKQKPGKKTIKLNDYIPDSIEKYSALKKEAEDLPKEVKYTGELNNKGKQKKSDYYANSRVQKKPFDGAAAD